MSPTVDIRLATPADVAAIRACAATAYSQYIADIGREPAPMLADFEALVAAQRIHIASIDEKLEGFIVYYPQDGQMHLENVAVSKSGHGIGGQLMAQCETAAARLGLSKITLYTNVKMAANLSLYSYLGYTETGRRREDGFDRVYFQKVLAL